MARKIKRRVPVKKNRKFSILYLLNTRNNMHNTSIYKNRLKDEENRNRQISSCEWWGVKEVK